MSAGGQKQEGVDPRAMQVALLDEIAERLLGLQRLEGDIRQLLLEQQPLGEVDPVPTLQVRRVAQRVDADPPWFGVTVHNDGVVPVFLLVNEGTGTPHRIDPGESWPFSFSRPVIRNVTLFTNSGNSVVRLVGMR